MMQMFLSGLSRAGTNCIFSKLIFAILKALCARIHYLYGVFIIFSLLFAIFVMKLANWWKCEEHSFPGLTVRNYVIPVIPVICGGVLFILSLFIFRRSVFIFFLFTLDELFIVKC